MPHMFCCRNNLSLMVKKMFIHLNSKVPWLWIYHIQVSETAAAAILKSLRNAILNFCNP
jgi:hypothetical protein